MHLLPLGWLAGVAIGLTGGCAELLLAPLAEPARVPFVLGADGLLGGAWGLLLGLAVSPRSARDGTRALLLAGIGFPAFAAGLGLLANRVVLRGTHFLSPTSLAADAVALVAAAGVSVAIGRWLAARLPARLPGGAIASGVVAVALGAAAFLPGRSGREEGSAPDLPSVVLVSIDTLRPDRLSIGGEPRATSPEIDRLVREGIQLGDAVAVSPGSAASHAALLTSRYPVSSGVWANFTVMDESVTTLAETMRAMGYRTGGFVTNTFLGARFGFDQGFDAYVESGVVERLEEPSRAALARSLALVQIVDRLRGRLEPGWDPSFETALAWIRESERPALFFVHLMDVHSPYVPPHPWGPRFGADPDGDGEGPRNRYGWRPSEEAYVAEIRFADTKIGRLRRALEREGLLDRAIVVLTSDHGENLTDHEPRFGHGRTLYDATVSILASVRAPGRVAAGRVGVGSFENVDVVPTLASLLDWPPLPDWEGRALGDIPEGRVTLSQLDRDFAVRTRDRKTIVWDDGRREEFALDTDPGETAPVVLTPERRAMAEAILDGFLARHSTPLYSEYAQSVRPDELSPETIEKLKGLGYLD